MKMFRAFVLVSVLACSVFAGEIPNPTQPPVIPPASTNGEIHNPKSTETTEITLALISSVLSLF